MALIPSVILTVAIPTYNRPDKVLKTVNKLLPQLGVHAIIMVFDNCSDVNIAEFLKQNIPDFDASIVQVIRHKVNIGPDANFARCFEYCDTPWIWTLSDDDDVMDNAIAIIVQEVERYKHKDLIGFNFNSNCNLVGRKEPIIIGNIHDMSHKLDFFGNWLFMATAVYNTQEYLKHLRFATWGAYTMVSQIVPAMVAISKNKTLVLSEKTIANNIPSDNPEDTWSGAKLSMVVPMLLEAPVKFNKDFKAFGEKLAVQQIGTVSAIFFATLKSVKGNVSLIDDYHLYLHKQHFYRTIQFRKNKINSYLIFWCYSFLLKNKNVLSFLLKSFPGRFNKRIKYFVNFDLLMR